MLVCTLALTRAVLIVDAPIGIQETVVDSHEEATFSTFYDDILSVLGQFKSQTDLFTLEDNTEATEDKIKSLEHSRGTLWMAIIELQSAVHALGCALLLYTLLTTTLLTFYRLYSRKRRADKFTAAVVEPIQVGDLVRDDIKKTSPV